MAKKERTLDWLIKKYMTFLSSFGMEENDIREHYATWKLKSNNIQIEDFLWHIFQMLLHDTAIQAKSEYELHQNHSKIYSEMTKFRRQVEKKKENRLHQLSLSENILAMQANLGTKLSVVVIADCCPYCNSLNGNVYEIKDALKNKYLGSEKCTRELGCRCVYAFRSS